MGLLVVLVGVIVLVVAVVVVRWQRRDFPELKESAAHQDFVQALQRQTAGHE